MENFKVYQNGELKFDIKKWNVPVYNTKDHCFIVYDNSGNRLKSITPNQARAIVTNAEKNKSFEIKY